MLSDVAITLSLEMAIHFPGCWLISLSYFLISIAAFSKGVTTERYGYNTINLFILASGFLVVGSRWLGLDRDSQECRFTLVFVLLLV